MKTKTAVVRINDAFRKAGRDERLVRGRGYFYVRGELSGHASTSIYVWDLVTDSDYELARNEINTMFQRAGIDFQIDQPTTKGK